MGRAAQLRAADEAWAAGALDAEIEHLGRALRWRAPLVDHDERALARLWAIGEAEQARGEAGRDGALAAFREIRRALLATRSWGDIPQRERWEAANERIAALMAEQSEAMGLPAAADPRAELHEQLARVPGPDPLRADLSALAFVGWLGCVVGFVLRGLDAKGRLRLPAAARWGVGALGLLVAWAVLLAVAHG
ncbi:MAG: hypothetical protein H6712_22760 [Myxococcales bacterium]|nr:hypothetical protein [Myxococcales bacterium]